MLRRAPRVSCICGHVFRERERAPCRKCGSLNRVIWRDASEVATTNDRAT